MQDVSKVVTEILGRVLRLESRKKILRSVDLETSTFSKMVFLGYEM